MCCGGDVYASTGNSPPICETSARYAKIAFTEKINGSSFSDALDSINIIIDSAEQETLKARDLAALKMLVFDVYEFVYNDESKKEVDVIRGVEQACKSKIETASVILKNRVTLCEIMALKINHAKKLRESGYSKPFAEQILHENDREIDKISDYAVAVGYESDNKDLEINEFNKCIGTINAR